MADAVESLEAAVGQALSGHRCVSGWLGYGNTLFLGFGSKELPERDASGRRSTPPYELQTSMASWHVECAMSADSDNKRWTAEQAIQALIGRSVAAWRLTDYRGLVVEFDAGTWLEVAVPSEVDPESSDLDQWWFCLPGSRYLGIGSNGRVVEGWTNRPSDSNGPEYS